MKQFGRLFFSFLVLNKVILLVLRNTAVHECASCISKWSVSQVVSFQTVLWLETISLLGFLTVKVSDLSYVLCRLGPGVQSV